MKLSKYFWDLNTKALKETAAILRSPDNPKFTPRMITLLSRLDQPKELFTIISVANFIEVWPKIRSHWFKLKRQSDFRDWWETIYEQLLEENQQKQKKVLGRPLDLFRKIGGVIRARRIEMGLSQKQLGQRIGMKQPDISSIEEGKKNITLYTLIRLCKIMEIKTIHLY